MLQAIITSELIKIIRAEVTTNILSGISAHVDASVIGGGNERYEGDYEITPTFETQVLDTAHKVLEDEFIEDYNSNQGFDFCNFIVKVKDIRIRFNIWELTGNEEMRKTFLSSICNINLSIIVYSIEK